MKDVEDKKEHGKELARKWLLPGSQTLFLGILATIALFHSIGAMKSVLMPFLFAWVLTAILRPFVDLLNKWKIPHVVAVTSAILLTVFIFFVAGGYLYEVIRSLAEKFNPNIDNGYTAKLKDLLNCLYSMLPNRAVEVLKNLDWANEVGNFVTALPKQILSFSSKVVMVLIIMAFLLFEQHGFARKLHHAFPNTIAFKIKSVLDSITHQVSRYLLLQMVISAATGICVWLALWALGIELAPTWGVLAFILNFIPTIGSIIASIPPVLVALMQYAPETYRPAIYATIALLAIQMTIGNVISPRVMGEHLNLSPVAVIVSLLFWAWLWGPGGALLSVPITAAIKIVCDNIATLTPIGVILGSTKKRTEKEQ